MGQPTPASPVQYSAPPPAYEETAPLVTNHDHDTSGADQTNEDVPDDFKYGTTVGQCDREVRFAFIRKVYAILTAQLLFTTVLGGVFMLNSSVQAWIMHHVWSMYVAVGASLVTLLVLMWKRRSYPLNFALLALFTLCEAATIGFVVSLYDSRLVLQALLLTLGIFVALTLFTLQSSYDFSRLGPVLGFALWGIILVGFIQIFFPFNRTFDLVMAIVTAVIFCGYIVYDTHAITHRLSPDEYIAAAVELYLDVINLFIALLRILSDSRE
ncbi:hypothetical protein H4R34_004835 [Dimargaris verticillata]|uniref:Inhibitor of apoptosis-promoting Bax1-domain-containing protein n=1 Tax=Dimargaris verticillata TaxID=2761393 RepID=A0A9W8B445_9FUNG|nr:hypothetical protein H4R34_004835 [Dimargaris verticillata]